ncbi:putative DNA primase [Vibrio phage vB_VpaP_G1]|uniref:DNA primase n=1 Tax=Vibrio phage vB_VpaP_G1 TaxID=2862773 RepID=A0AAE7WUQ5_9CAUD|nr:putative DNA primase [Vibrio phage vB_VpaP_G1]YP_010648436.1 putative DNA primase [Vibrio phage vB_VpaP_G1]QYW05804.1 putative DNA primase [Vibrio phage vB_VpaP_G1]QYW05848.1 putative DNA primase [Vibrio phage vB_VpaP_G1]
MHDGGVMKYLENRHWLPYAQLLAAGESDKVPHVGCGDRPSLFVINDADSYWAYCHRCRCSGRVDKQYQRIKMKAPDKTGWYPKEIIPFMKAVVDNPRQYTDMLKRTGLATYVTLLRYSADTMRVYFPDDSGNYLGLDVTGQATARWYAPTKRAVMYVNGDSTVVVTQSILTYLEAVRAGHSAAYASNQQGRKALYAWIARSDYECVSVKSSEKDALAYILKELRAIVPVKYKD